MKNVAIKIKPLSVNEVWRGRRFKTDAYKQYEKDLLRLLPRKLSISLKEKLTIMIKLGVSSKNADIDNPVKPILDILQKKYGFNDKQIYELNVLKKDVKKGEEYFTFIFFERL